MRETSISYLFEINPRHRLFEEYLNLSERGKINVIAKTTPTRHLQGEPYSGNFYSEIVKKDTLKMPSGMSSL